MDSIFYLNRAKKKNQKTTNYTTIDYKLLRGILGFNKNMLLFAKMKNVKKVPNQIAYIKSVKNYFEQKNKGFLLFLKRYIKLNKSIKAPKISRLNKNQHKEKLLKFNDIDFTQNHKNHYINHRYILNQRQKAFKEKLECIIKIQSFYRSYYFRTYFFNDLKEELEENVMRCIIKIQKFVRGRLCKKNLIISLIKDKITSERKKQEEKIEKTFIKYYNINTFKFNLLVENILNYRYNSIVKIQSFIRQKTIHNKVNNLMMVLKNHYSMTYPFYARKVQLKVHIFTPLTFKYFVLTYDFIYDKLLNTFIVCIKYTDFLPGKYRCQLIVDGEATCDGRFPHIEYNDGKMYNLITFKKDGVLMEKESGSSLSMKNAYGDDEFIEVAERVNERGMRRISGNSSMEELRTNLESHTFENKEETIRRTSFTDLINFE